MPTTNRRSRRRRVARAARTGVRAVRTGRRATPPGLALAAARGLVRRRRRRRRDAVMLMPMPLPGRNQGTALVPVLARGRRRRHPVLRTLALAPLAAGTGAVIGAAVLLRKRRAKKAGGLTPPAPVERSAIPETSAAPEAGSPATAA